MHKQLFLFAVLIALTIAWPQSFYSDIATYNDKKYAIASNDCPDIKEWKDDERKLLWLYQFDAVDSKAGLYNIYVEKGKRCKSTYLQATADCNNVELGRPVTDNVFQQWTLFSDQDHISGQKKNFKLLSKGCPGKEILLTEEKPLQLIASQQNCEEVQWVNLTYYERNLLHMFEVSYGKAIAEEGPMFTASSEDKQNPTQDNILIPVIGCTQKNIKETWESDGLDWTQYDETVDARSWDGNVYSDDGSWRPITMMNHNTNRTIVWNDKIPSEYSVSSENVQQCKTYNVVLQPGEKIHIDYNYKIAKISSTFDGFARITYRSDGSIEYRPISGKVSTKNQLEFKPKGTIYNMEENSVREAEFILVSKTNDSSKESENFLE